MARPSPVKHDFLVAAWVSLPSYALGCRLNPPSSDTSKPESVETSSCIYPNLTAEERASAAAQEKTFQKGHYLCLFGAEQVLA